MLSRTNRRRVSALMKRRRSRQSDRRRSCELLAAPSTPQPREFRLWAIGDAHVGTDIARKRESLADAIRQSEQGGKDGAPPFDWDIALNVGDFSGDQGPPEDDEGREVVRQYAAR